jgi:AcrR family transcriptional regulator
MPTNFLPSTVQIRVTERVYLRNPQESELGRKIISNSILLIDELGFEAFTFKKLAVKIGSTEASVYRYFENKHKLLIYLMSWYWHWLEYRLALSLSNISEPEKQLKIAIQTISAPIEEDMAFEHINEKSLFRIVIAESSKAYLSKEVDSDNREGYFGAFKNLTSLLKRIISEVNPKYPFPSSLASAIIETAHQQRFFSRHIPVLCDCIDRENDQTSEFVISLALNSLNR